LGKKKKEGGYLSKKEQRARLHLTALTKGEEFTRRGKKEEKGVLLGKGHLRDLL